MPSLKGNYQVEKRNVLNEMRSNNMTLQELRFLSIYLSKINSRDPSTRIVRFALTEFQRIMDLGRIDIAHMQQVTNSLLCKVVNIPNENGGYTGFQLFKECQVNKDDNDIWYVEINAHDRALPLMFEFKDKYFSYQLWNALRLRSSNQIRMYEILKQYEKLGSRTIKLEDLRLLLGVDPEHYAVWKDFRVRVLNSCQKALAENTDIKFTYEPIRKGVGKGTGRKITHVKFIIEKNKDHTDQLSLQDFIDLQPETKIPETEIIEDDPLLEYEEHLHPIAEACDYEFSNSKLQVIFNAVSIITDELVRYRLVKLTYDRMKMYADINEITSRFGYFQKILIVEVAKLTGK